MPARNATLKDRLSHVNEIEITVTGRKSGRKISLPIWFVFDEDTLYLLPVKGSETQWYRNVLNNPLMKVEAMGAEQQLNVTPVTDAKQISPVIEKFRAKYGPGDVKKYYSNFDVAVVAKLP